MPVRSLFCLVVEEVGDNNGCVVNNLLFSHPSHTRFLHKNIHSVRGGELILGKVHCLLVVDKLPKTVRGNDQKSVSVGVELAFGELGVRNDPSRVGNGITEGSGWRKVGIRVGIQRGGMIPPKGIDKTR